MGVSEWNASHRTPEELEENPNIDKDMPKDMRVPLPFWLSESLLTRNFVTLELPRCYGKQARQALRADPRSVDLAAKCSSYFALGVRLAKLIVDVALPGALVRAFAARCWGTADSAAFSGDKGAMAMKGLDWLECELFQEAHAMVVATRRWKERRSDRIAAIDHVLGKRRREELGSPITPSSRPRTS
ncbi:DNA replication complex GINS protein psf3 [Gracilaria domingensis]|nr:DNA replication complex GINS protein psf3 [Gracilaria domingensis]